MADSTVNYAWPFPTGGDSVAVHSDIEKMAKAADATVKTIEVESGLDQAKLDELEGRVVSVEGGVSTLDGRVSSAESDIAALQASEVSVTYLGDGVYEIS